MTGKKTPKGKKNSPDNTQKKLEEAEAAYQRLAADFANFQRRSEEEKVTLKERAKTELLESLFPIMDNLYRASTHAPEINLEDLGNLGEEDFKRIFSYFSGLRLIEKQLETALAEAGLTRIPSRGEVFNPNLHEAISYENSLSVTSDHIIDEIESGWQINGRVVRPAKVRVSKGA